MKIRDIDKQPDINAGSIEFGEITALALHSALVAGSEKMDLVKEFIHTNIRQLNDYSLSLLIDEINDAPFTMAAYNQKGDICHYINREYQRRQEERQAHSYVKSDS